jgi:hypothetical protein
VDRDTFGTLVLAAFGLVLASFVVLGFSRIVLPYRTARLLAAPTALLAAALVAALFVRSVLAVTGVRPLDDAE